MAVNIGARIGQAAGTGEVLVSGTVKDLVAGSGFEFAPAGEYDLKSLPNPVILFRANGPRVPQSEP